MGTLIVQCNQCQRSHTVDVAELEFDTVGSDDRQMGPEVLYGAEHDIYCTCENHIQISHQYSEYPIGVENEGTTDVTGAFVISDTL
ncbi:hypothetical protein [Chromobacterium sp. LK1]|uniref:hypothetical protein n=1 Tax=Chromobacterium sp. LK1 TaxID=1628193 RepID=UPI0012E139E3|nr:hypothetical protein [Chromobacterium sp. LK1]